MNMFLKMGYIKECFPGDMSHCSILTLEDQVFPNGYCLHNLKSFYEIGVYKCTFEYCRKYEVKMTRTLFKFTIYPPCEKALKNGRVKSKIIRKSSFGDLIFFTSHDYIWLLFICFLYCAKEGIAVEISKVS